MSSSISELNRLADLVGFDEKSQQQYLSRKGLKTWADADESVIESAVQHLQDTARMFGVSRIRLYAPKAKDCTAKASKPRTARGGKKKKRMD